MSCWINKKNKKLYKAITTVKNASNKNDYELLMLYKDVKTGEQYAREFNEFTDKFEASANYDELKWTNIDEITNYGNLK